MTRPLRVLIVEDSEEDTLLLVRELERAGYLPSFVRVDTAEAMRAALARPSWELVLADHSMPHFSAPEALQVLQESGCDAPFILVSGVIEAREAVRLMQCGARDYIDKQDLTRLVPAVERELRQAENDRQRRRAEEQLRLLGVAVSAAANAIFITDDKGKILWVNEAFVRLSGYQRDELIGQSPRLLKSGVHRPPFYEGLWRTILTGQVWAGEMIECRKDGTQYTVYQTITPIRSAGGRIAHFVAVQEDMTPRKEAEAKIEFLAYHDPLTGLPNRLLFADRLSQALSRARRDHRLVAVLFLDLDQFKAVNDTLGHACGDRLLKAVADRLTDCLRSTDSLARLGGDEFAIIQPDLASADGAARLAEKLLEVLGHPFFVDGHEVRTTSSVGITLYPPDDPEGKRLLENADMAMFQAKAEGRNRYAFFTRSLDAEARMRRETEVELAAAITNRQLVVHYQPQVDLDGGEIVGVEALVRWQHPTRGLLSPAAFVPVAESCGLILPLTDLVLRQACADLLVWQALGTPGLRVAVNISAAHLRDGKLVRSVTDALRETNLDPHCLELELTETALIRDEDAAIHTLSELERLGIVLSVDDFGTGYSSLKYLKRLPVKRLKIDQSFVRTLPHDPDSAVIVRATILLGHQLGLRVIGEGVETAEQFGFLRQHGCDEGQGYYFQSPQPADAIETLLRQGILSVV